MTVPCQWPDGTAEHVIAFVGEAPSTEEVEQGRPFVGPSGQIFNAALRSANIIRDQHLVTNVFDEQLPGNSVGNWCGSAAGADPEWVIPGEGQLLPEYRHHLDRLRAELERVKPNVIVPLGATALWALTGSTEIAQHRGSVGFATRALPGAKVLPALHPAFVRHQWKFFSVLIGDFIKAAAESTTPDIVWPKKRLLLAPTLLEVEDYVDNVLLKADLLSIDIETGWGQITCIGFAPSADEGMCIPFWDTTKPNRSYWATALEEASVWRRVKEVCESPVPKLGQFAGCYDAYWLLKRMGIRLMNYREDTRLMHHALYPELDKSLAFMSGSYTKQGAWKALGRHSNKRDE